MVFHNGFMQGLFQWQAGGRAGFPVHDPEAVILRVQLHMEALPHSLLHHVHLEQLQPLGVHRIELKGDALYLGYKV